MKWIVFSIIFGIGLGYQPYGAVTLQGQPLEKKIAPLSSVAESTHSYDVLHYRLDLEFSMEDGSVKGMAKIILKSMEDNLDSLDLHLVGLTVDSVRVMNEKIAFSRFPPYLRVYLSSSFNIGDSLDIEVFYYGIPQAGYYYFPSFEGMPDTTSYSFTETGGSKYWFPCFDQPWDKANSCEIIATVPSGFVVASNGLLISVDTVDNKVTYHWREEYPIATYLMSVAISKFITFSDWYARPSKDSVEIKYYLYPEDSLAAVDAFKDVVDMMEFFSSKYGDYPFEKYGMAVVYPFGGGMEHQTMTTIDRSWVVYANESGIAHELAHQWWGDMVTCFDWANIWINEGFATYSQALYSEHKYGGPPFQREMLLYARNYFEQDSIKSFAIYDPPPGELFNWGIIYCKGAWVLHMLRYILEDEKFWQVFPIYGERFKYGNANVEDFRGVCEEVYGKPLDWFFDEWIYNPGHPVYEWSWRYTPTKGDSGIVKIQVRQVQKNGPIFKMPIVFEIKALSKSELCQVRDSLSFQEFEIPVDEKPLSVNFDPEYNILKKEKEVAPGLVEKEVLTPLSLSIMPSPIKNKAVFRFSLPVSGYVSLEIFDLTGRRVRTLITEEREKGLFEITWTPDKDLSSGVYFCRFYTKNTTLMKKIVLTRKGKIHID